MIRLTDILAELLPVMLITIALLLACALRIVCRGTASRSPLCAGADDPFLFPFGEMPTVPRERLMVARDFRAWGIPQRIYSAGALRRNESGGRPASSSGTAVVLNFPKRSA